MSILDWIQGSTLSLTLDDLAKACSLRSILHTNCPTIVCYRHHVSTSVLLIFRGRVPTTTCGMAPCIRYPVRINVSFVSTLVYKPCRKVCACYSITFLNPTPVFDWCALRFRSKNKDHKNTCFRKIELCLLFKSY